MVMVAEMLTKIQTMMVMDLTMQSMIVTKFREPPILVLTQDVLILMMMVMRI